MNLTMIKTTLREIRHSLGRFISILCIVALGAGFFAGLKSAKPDMVETANTFLSDHSFFDYRLLNTYGFDDESVSTALKDKNVEKAEGTISYDAIVNFEETDVAVKMMSLAENVNTISLTAGRMPKNDNECVGDARYFGEKSIGEEITLSDENDEETTEKFKNKTYKIVGVAETPVYLNYERGTTQLLNGSLLAFTYLPKTAFTTDTFTELNLKLKGNYEIYSDDYKNFIDSKKSDIEELTNTIADSRYEKIKEAPINEYQKNEEEYEENLDDYNTQKEADYKKLDEALEKINSSQKELSDGEKQYTSSLEEYNENKSAFDKAKSELDTSKTQVQSGLSEINASIDKLELGISQYESYEVLDDTSTKVLETMKSQLELAEEKKNELEKTQSTIDEKGVELAAQETALENAEKTLSSTKEQIDNGKADLTSAKNEYESSKEKADTEYENAKEKLDDAKLKLDDGKKEIDDIKKPETYTLDRESNVGYVCFENDSGMVDGLAAVFPIFFFLVAALMCMTTMTRMVDEQRTDIGVLKALGYSKAIIMIKYISYSGLAGIFGCLIGFYGGSYLFPQAIWIAYKTMYNFAPLTVKYNYLIALGLLIIVLMFTIGTTILSCYAELNQNAAQIMRPKAPKNGKHTLIEKLPFFKHLSFLRKVSFRNLVRYKGRFVFMVLGIAGCMALLLTGFGISDSIQKIGDYQYGEIMKYDYEVMFSNNMGEEEQTQFENSANYAGKMVFVHNLTYDVQTPNGKKSATVIATDKKDIADVISFKNQGKPVDFPNDNQAVVTKKFAELNGIVVGSKIYVVDSDMKETELTVSGICDNYVYNYVYTTLKSLKDGFLYEPAIKTAFVDLKEDSDEDISTKLMKEDKVRNVSSCADIRLRVSNMLDSLDYIVLLVKICAGALAFVVLYNLTNINVTERIREIATIKVLGFYPIETSTYIFGENFILTGIGAFLGIFLGKALHSFVMSKIIIDIVSFNVRIDAISIVLSIALTFVFAVIVDFFMYFKLQKIDMAQSLKSIE